MDRNFKFPPPSPTRDAPPVPSLPKSQSSKAESKTAASPKDNDSGYAEGGDEEGKVVEDGGQEEYGSPKGKGKGKEKEETPSSPPQSAVPMEAPPPDPVEKEKDRVATIDEADDDIGATVEVPL